MSNIWFTSDLHIGHTPIAALRGFSTVAAHDATLADRWDAIVRPSDQVWILGDLSIGGKATTAALNWIAARPGVKHLIAGNHDDCHPMRSKAHKQRRFLQVFESVAAAGTLKIAGQRTLLSHFPYAGDPDGDHTTEPRYPEWRLPDTGQWLLHGHTHSPIQQRGRQLHVGVDAHGLAPVSRTWIEDRINEKG